MFKPKSLTKKLILMGSIMLAFLITYVTITYIFTHHMKGEATRINLAGQLRYLSFEMAWLSQKIAERIVVTDNSQTREHLIAELKEHIERFEKITVDLKDGNKELGIKPIEHPPEALPILNAIIDEWNNSFKPTLLKIAELPEDAPEQEARALLKRYDFRIEEYVEEEINKFVKVLAVHHEMEIKRFDIFRFYVIGFFFVATLFIVFYARQSVIKPIMRLRDATREVEKGNFDVRVDIKSKDEIGVFGNTFNNMAQTLNTLFHEKGERLKELHVLNEIATASTESLTLDIMLNKIMDELLNLESLRLEKRGAIFLCNKNKLELVVSRNFSNEHRKLCTTVPYGECLCGLCAQEGEILFSEDSYEDKRHTKPCSGIERHGHIILPLKSRDKKLGVLSLFLPEGVKISPRDKELYKSLADIISVAVHNALNHRQVAMLAQSLESSKDLIVITDHYGKILHVNPSVLAYVGYTQEEIKGKKVSVMQSPKNPPELGMEILQKTLEGGWEGEVINIRKDGSEYPVYMTTAPVKDEDGNIIALVGIARDITERKQAEERLRRYSEELEEKVKERTKELEIAKLQAESANRAKSDFLANVSHELRTPLNAIIGFSDMMIKGIGGGLTEGQMEYVKDIHNSGRTLLSYINELLDLSKIESGAVTLEYSKVDVRELLKSCLFFFKEKTLKHGINLTVDVEEGVGMIEADPARLKQVVVNLLSNAVKFTPDGGSITVQARLVSKGDALARGDVSPLSLRGEAEAISEQSKKDEIATSRILGTRNDNLGDFIEISVTDTGIGIKKEDIPRLFTRFQQLETPHTKRYEGTGLGLAICKEIVELHGGRIWCESEYGKGSKFTFIIPVTRSTNSAPSSLSF